MIQGTPEKWALILGASSGFGAAACLALEAKCDVQAVDYAVLRTRLLDLGQVLELR